MALCFRQSLQPLPHGLTSWPQAVKNQCTAQQVIWTGRVPWCRRRLPRPSRGIWVLCRSTPSPDPESAPKTLSHLYLQFTIDKHTECMVPFCVLSRTNLAYSPLTLALSPRVSEICGLFNSLCALFSPPVVCLQKLAASFCKTPGVGGTRTLPRRASLPPSYAPRGAFIPCGLNRLRILPVTTEVYPFLATRLPRAPRGYFPKSFRMRRSKIASPEVLWNEQIQKIPGGGGRMRATCRSAPRLAR